MLNSIKKTIAISGKKISLVVLMFFFLAAGVHAQFGAGKPEDIEQVKKRKLIVIAEAPDEKVVKDVMKKKESSTLEDYKAVLTHYNENMKAVVEKFWPYASNGIEFKTYDEVVDLKKKKNKDYAVLYCYLQYETYQDGFGANYSKRRMNSNPYISRDDYNMLYNMNYSLMTVELVENFDSKMPVGASKLSDILPTKTALIFGIKDITNYFNYRTLDKKNKAEAKKMTDEIEASSKNKRKMDVTKLKDMTLMIRKDLIDKSLEETDIKKYYPYPHKIITKEELDEMFMNDKVPPNTAILIDFPESDKTSRTDNIHANIYVYDANTFWALTIVAQYLPRLDQKCLEKFVKK